MLNWYLCSVSTWTRCEQWQLRDGEGHHSDRPEPGQGPQRSVHPPQVRDRLPSKTFYSSGTVRLSLHVNVSTPPNSKILISKQKIIDLFPRIEKTLESIKDADNTVMQMQIKRQREFWHLLKIACVSRSANFIDTDRQNKSPAGAIKPFHGWVFWQAPSLHPLVIIYSSMRKTGNPPTVHFGIFAWKLLLNESLNFLLINKLFQLQRLTSQSCVSASVPQLFCCYLIWLGCSKLPSLSLSLLQAQNSSRNSIAASPESSNLLQVSQWSQSAQPVSSPHPLTSLPGPNDR